jgi:hypothetical protein
MTKVFDIFGGRKCFLALLFYTFATVGFFISWISPDNWVQSLEWCLAIYLGANAIKSLPDALHRTATATEVEESNGTNAVFEFFGGRKMFLALLFIVTITTAFFIPHGDSSGFLPAAIWLSGLKWCLVIYLGANTVKALPDAIARKSAITKE